MAVRLTETAIKSGIKRAQDTGKLVELIDAATAGLRLRISPRGRRSWVVATRDAWGSLRRFPVGEYPELGISDARARAAVVRAEVKNGSDPIAAARLRRQAAKEGKNGINTLGALVNLYARFNGEAMKSWPEQLKRIQKVFAAQMATPLVKLTLSDLQMAADGYPAKQAASAAVR
ncbi:integrase arm-type DNA-binding domain-containing protein, partial [Acidiphilium sp.]|uniref:integrase arm-type DNA-binding domain-containing protein n=1 Tax=Acidiphilium sp. TaxID=527 RepID=UPI00258FB636